MSINERNYEEYLIRYMENELDEEERKEVELYMLLDREAEDDWKVLKNTKLTPDKVSFPNKALLYKDEEDEKSVPVVRKMGWWYAASAAAAMIALVLVFNLRNTEEPAEIAVITPEKAIENKITNPESAELKAEAPAIVASTPEIKTVNNPKPAVAKEVNQLQPKQEFIASAAPVTISTVDVKLTEVNVENASLPALATIEIPEISTKSESIGYSAPQEDAPSSLLEGMARIVRKNIDIKHQKVGDNQRVIALSFQTENVSLSKTFKYNF